MDSLTRPLRQFGGGARLGSAAEELSSICVSVGGRSVIEDSSYGVQAARAAGMRAFGYCGGLTPASRLEGPGTVVFDDMRNLAELLATATH